MRPMRRVGNVLLWSAISAAFIGPGTVTTAGKAGAEQGYGLIWALLLSTALCFVLQEAAASLAIRTGRSLPGAILARHGAALSTIVVVAVVLGCAAFEAGNVLGAVAGASLALPLEGRALVVLTGVLAAAMLAMPRAASVARAMGALVALMGISFAGCAILARPPLGELVQGALLPRIPVGSETLVLGLFGTTVVPYNLFLGSRLARDQRLQDMRLGLAVAVPLGGLISAAIVVVGAESPAPFAYEGLAGALGERLGGWAPSFFALGLFAAGLSSAITAPLAAGTSFDDLALARGEGTSPRRAMTVSMGVLVVGLALGLAGFRPVPIIVLAQAANGLLLPFVAFFLLRAAIDDRRERGERFSPVGGAALHAAVALSFLLGLRAALSALAPGLLSPAAMLALSALGALMLLLFAHRGAPAR